MSSRHDEKRKSMEGDRLSSLPDDLIYKILSLISLRQAIEISTLSSRWRYKWTSMPYLDFSTQSFSTLSKFSEFVTNVLSRHKYQVKLSSVKLSFPGKATQVFVQRILNYASSRNVEQLTVVSVSNHIKFPIDHLTSQSHKHLMLTRSSGLYSCTLTSTWYFPALTTLYLDRIKLDHDLFSNCPNLKNLTLICCDTKIQKSHLNICLSKLSNLTLEQVSCNVVNVEAAQLKNLIMRENYYHVNSSADDVLSLENVDLTISNPHNAQTIVVLLQQLRSVKFLRLNLEIVELLSSSVELISHQPSPFANLKSLKIYPFNYNDDIDDRASKKVNVSTVIENYFLDNSPISATLTLVSREEIRAHRLMETLQGLLKQWKANGEKNKACIDQGDVENQRAQQQTIKESHFAESLTRIKGYWSDLNKWYEEENEKTSRIISLLQKVEKLLTKLPASQRAKMQPMYSSLNAKADTFINNMMDFMKILCDKKARRSNVNLHELATTSQPLSEMMDVEEDFATTSAPMKASRVVDLGLTRILDLHSPSSEGNASKGNASKSGQSSGSEKKRKHVVIDLSDNDTQDEEEDTMVQVKNEKNP